MRVLQNNVFSRRLTIKTMLITNKAWHLNVRALHTCKNTNAQCSMHKEPNPVHEFTDRHHGMLCLPNTHAHSRSMRRLGIYKCFTQLTTHAQYIVSFADTHTIMCVCLLNSDCTRVPSETDRAYWWFFSRVTTKLVTVICVPAGFSITQSRPMSHSVDDWRPSSSIVPRPLTSSPQNLLCQSLPNLVWSIYWGRRPEISTSLVC